MKKPLTVFTLLFSLLSFGAFAQNTLVIRPDNTDFLMSVPPSNPFNSVNNAIKYRVYVVNSTFPSGTLAPLGNCKVTFVSTNGFVPPNTTYSNLDNKTDYKVCQNCNDVDVRWDNVPLTARLTVQVETEPGSGNTCPYVSATKQPYSASIRYIGTSTDYTVNGIPNSQVTIPCGIQAVTISVPPVTNATNLAIYGVPSTWTGTTFQGVSSGNTVFNLQSDASSTPTLAVSAGRGDVPTD